MRQPADKTSLIERGRRLKKVRTLACLTRDELAVRAGVSRASMSYWENATYSGLSHKAAEKLIPVLREEGVWCSIEWLLLGLGHEPSRVLENSCFPEENKKISFQQEIDLFKALHPMAVVMEVPHNGLSPFLKEGDYIGGMFDTKQPASLDISKIMRVWR